MVLMSPKNWRKVRDQETLNEAANRLEELTIVGKEIVLSLRSGDEESYAKMYWLRRELGYIVNTLGVGVPVSVKNWE